MFIAEYGKPKVEPAGYQPDPVDLVWNNGLRGYILIDKLRGCCAVGVLYEFPWNREFTDADFVRTCAWKMNEERYPYYIATLAAPQITAGIGELLEKYLGFKKLDLPFWGNHNRYVTLYGLSFTRMDESDE